VSLRSYASFWGIESDEANKARGKRKQVEMELSVTKDYQTAIFMSQYLSLSHDQWRMLYPHLDAEKVFEVAPERKIRKVDKKVQELEQEALQLKDTERFALMDALYPKAKEMEKIAGNKTALEEVARQHPGYGFASAFGDGLIKIPFKISPDGQYVINDGIEREGWQLD